MKQDTFFLVMLQNLEEEKTCKKIAYSEATKKQDAIFAVLESKKFLLCKYTSYLDDIEKFSQLSYSEATLELMPFKTGQISFLVEYFR